MYRFENALGSGSKPKRVHIVFVDGRKRIKMKTMNDFITGACVCSIHIEFNLRHKSTRNSIVF